MNNTVDITILMSTVYDSPAYKLFTNGTKIVYGKRKVLCIFIESRLTSAAISCFNKSGRRCLVDP